MGVAGASPLEYAHVLRSRGCAYHPDLVLVSFFVGNDFTDIVVPDSAPRTLASLFVAPLVVKRLMKLGAEWFAHPAQRESAEYQIPPRVQLRMTSGGPYDDMYHDLPDIPSFSEGAFLEIEQSRLRVCRSPTPAALQEKIDLAFGALGEICALAPGRVMLAIIPDEFQVNRELLDQLLVAHGEKAEEFDLALPQRLLADFARAHDTPCVDLLPALRVGQEKLRRVYRLRDTHWNIRGHRIAAFELADAVERELPRLMKD
jgi:hypothetical protein